MGGVMPDRERDAAIKRLRRAAEALLAERRNPGLSLERSERAYRVQQLLLKMSDAWRDFPECERDERVPSPEEVLARCDAYDRQKEEAERIAARMKQ